MRVINDIRPGYGTKIHLDKRAIFNGAPINELLKDESDSRQKHLYKIVQHGVIVSSVALSQNDFEAVNDILNPIEFTRVKSDINGNPRFVCHFLAFISPKDEFTSIDSRYSLALQRARQFGGRKFHNKQYGGGIVFQMYDGQRLDMSQKIKELVKSL